MAIVTDIDVELEDPTFYGPYLRFAGFDVQSNTLHISVLAVYRSSQYLNSNYGLSPVTHKLFWREVGSGGTSSVDAVLLAIVQGWSFLRFNCTVQCGPVQREVEYAVVDTAAEPSPESTFTPRCRFAVPAAGQPWRWAYHSCNGFSDDADAARLHGIQPLWRDVMACHQQRPFHVMVGGGDQIHNDGVWRVQPLAQWQQTIDRNSQLAAAFDVNMQQQVEQFYLDSYLSHWSEAVYCDALAAIPHLMVWGDHDVFDGWGSYLQELQASPVFQGVFKVARKFYALFQLHTTPERAVFDNQVFGARDAWHWVGCVGPDVALVALDTRSERTTTQIISDASWAMVRQRIANLPAGIRHVVVLASVPIIYPHVPVLESAAKYLSDTTPTGLAAVLQKSGVLTQFYAKMYPGLDIYDDLLEHWSSHSHREEKRAAVAMLQALAAQRRLRVSFLCGGAHLAAGGHFGTRGGALQAKDDHRYMQQVVCSAIGGAPPPRAVVLLLKHFAEFKDLDAVTSQELDPIFHGDKLQPNRNWCVVEARTYVACSPAQDGALVLQLRVEHDRMQTTNQPMLFCVEVPLLELTPAALAVCDAIVTTGNGAAGQTLAAPQDKQQQQHMQARQQQVAGAPFKAAPAPLAPAPPPAAAQQPEAATAQLNGKHADADGEEPEEGQHKRCGCCKCCRCCIM